MPGSFEDDYQDFYGQPAGNSPTTVPWWDSRNQPNPVAPSFPQFDPNRLPWDAIAGAGAQPQTAGGFDPKQLLKLLPLLATIPGFRGGGSPDMSGLQEAQGLTNRRLELQNPLFEAMTRTAFSRLPTASRQGLTMSGARPNGPASMTSGGPRGQVGPQQLEAIVRSLSQQARRGPGLRQDIGNIAGGAARNIGTSVAKKVGSSLGKKLLKGAGKVLKFLL